MVKCFYLLLYLNSQRGHCRLKYLCPVISVNMKRLPGNTKNQLLTRSWTGRVRFLASWVGHSNCRSTPRTTFACSPPVNRLISFSPTCSLLLPWQASPTGNVGSEAAKPVVSRPGRLSTSKILKALSLRFVMTPPRHHLPALPSEISELRQN